jgi:hypothetical protein
MKIDTKKCKLLEGAPSTYVRENPFFDYRDNDPEPSDNKGRQTRFELTSVVSPVKRSRRVESLDSTEPVTETRSICMNDLMGRLAHLSLQSVTGSTTSTNIAIERQQAAGISPLYEFNEQKSLGCISLTIPSSKIEHKMVKVRRSARIANAARS